MILSPRAFEMGEELDEKSRRESDVETEERVKEFLRELAEWQVRANILDEKMRNYLKYL
jgi:hypothetical protein